VANFTEKDVLRAIREAFFCGIVSGRFDERSRTCPRTHDNPITQEESDSELAKVEAEYLPTWPGDLLMAGAMLPGETGDLVRNAEHEGWLRKQKVPSEHAFPIGFHNVETIN
jgi:hypothetical protein